VAEPPRRLLALFGPASTEATSATAAPVPAARPSPRRPDPVADDAEAAALSPSQIASLFRQRLDGLGDLAVVGEVSGFRGSVGAHWYFDLKDAESRVSVSFFTSANRRHRGPLPQNGDLVVVAGRPSFYGPQGRAQLIASSLTAAGSGALERALEALRARLAAEGLFAEERKRALPALPSCVGIVTSLQTAAVRDVVKVIRSRAPSMSVVVAHTAVQGPAADVGREIAQAIRRLDDSGGCDVILVVRGGGSREDLRPFDEESVVRAVVACRVPVVSGVGHEIDVTLCDHAADRRAATPSHAAELAVPNLVDVEARIVALEQRLQSSTAGALAHAGRSLAVLQARLPAPATLVQHHGRALVSLEARLACQSPRARLDADRARLDALDKRLLRSAPTLTAAEARLAQLRDRLDDAMARRVADGEGRLVRAVDRLEALSPLAVLKRGWALATVGDRLARADDLVRGARLRLRIDGGDADVVVDEVRAPMSRRS
jgi:exodeoxyribonuclease VII large subunit